MRISRNSRQCIPHSPPLHRLLPVALVGVTGLLSDAHFPLSAEPHAHIGLTFQSLSAICPQATPQVHGLTTSRTCRSLASLLTRPHPTSSCLNLHHSGLCLCTWNALLCFLNSSTPVKFSSNVPSSRKSSAIAPS